MDLSRKIGYGNSQTPSQTLSEQRDGRRMGVRRTLSYADDAVGTAAAVPIARCLQCLALDRSLRRSVALHARRLSALGSGLPANAALDQGRLLRGDRARSARTLACGAGSSRTAHRGPLRQPNDAIHTGER